MAFVSGLGVSVSNARVARVSAPLAPQVAAKPASRAVLFMGVGDDLKKAGEKVQDAAGDAAKGVKKQGEKVGDAMKDGVDSAKDAGDDAGSSMKNAADKAGSNLEKGADKVSDAGSDAADNVKDAADDLTS